MALKPDREEFFHDIKHYVDTVCERGGILSVSTAGSGGYPGDSNNVAAYAANPSGAKVVGILLQDVVDYDVNRQHENFDKGGFQARKGMKVLAAKGGWYTTNMIASGVNPSGGDPAYLAASGMISNTQATGAPKIGTFDTSKDQDGYAAVRINLV